MEVSTERSSPNPHLMTTMTPVFLEEESWICHDSQRGVYCLIGYNHLISNKRVWNNCLIKRNQEILLDFSDFALKEQLEDTRQLNGCYLLVKV